MSAIIGGIFVTAMMAIVMPLYFMESLRSGVSWSQVIDQKILRIENRIQTWVILDSADVLPQGGDYPTVIKAKLNNRGSTAIGRFDEMHLVAMYTNSSGHRVINRLVHVEGSASMTNEWMVSNIIPDTLEPGVLNPGEQATLTLVLDSNVMQGTYGTLHLATSNGVTTSAVFAGPDTSGY